MATDNGWITPVHETHFTTEAGDHMLRVVSRRKAAPIRIYIQFPDGERLGLSVDSKRVLAVRGPMQEPLVTALDVAEKTAQ